MQNLKEQLKKVVFDANFNAMGICKLNPFDENIQEKILVWYDNAMYDQMLYLKRHLPTKLNPNMYFEKAKSAIVLAANFFRPTQEHRIALYAQSQDYHNVLNEKIKPILNFLTENGGEQKVSIDSSPLSEKLLAQRAGLGWIGKNTLLINPTNGPWNFLCVILTSLELPIDAPLPNDTYSCKDCNLCIELCPTNALSQFGLDAKRCISNLTIERKTPLTQEEQKLTQKNIFGCDLCLKICPYGKDAPKTPILEFQKTIKLSKNPDDNEIENNAQNTPIVRMLKFKKNKPS